MTVASRQFFRRARVTDGQLLFRLRRERERGGWYRDSPTDFDGHMRWLLERVSDPLVTLMVWHDVGVVRVDSNGEFAFDGPVEMIRDFLGWWPSKLKATVDDGDVATWETLEAAGFTLFPSRSYVWRP